MFELLSQKLQKTFKQLAGKGRLTPDNIKDALRQVRIALLEADVAVPVIKQFLEHIETRAVGQEVLGSLSPDQMLIKIVKEGLTELMGAANEPLHFNTQPPAVILMAGLQGSGKTTTTAKLAYRLQEFDKKKVMVTSCDIYRPAAIKQLETLAQQYHFAFYPSTSQDAPKDIVKGALDAARKEACDVLLIDTAGRLHVDAMMMDEIKQLHHLAQPIETLFVVDSMTGQDAAHTAKAFNDALPLTGVILTKADGDARGGGALSIRMITDKPIKFIGMGEKVDALEPFHPDRMAARILGMGDMLTLIEEATQKIDQKQAEKSAKKLQKGQFDLEDFREQIQQLKKMGGLQSLLKNLPMNLNLPTNMLDNKMFSRYEAIINSMTRQERRFPDLIRGSRKQRIATGSGTTVQDINKLLKQFEQMQKMIKKFGKGGAGNNMQNMQKMMRNLPPGMFPGGGMPPF